MSLAVVDQRYATADQNAAIKGNLDHSGAVGLVVGDGNRVTARTAAQLRAVAGPVARQARRHFQFIAVPFQPEQRFHASAVQPAGGRSEEHTSELQSLMRISYAVFCLKKKKKQIKQLKRKISS